MKSLRLNIVLTVAYSTAAIFFSSSTLDAQQGWLEKATGIRTPEPIRKIAPNGIRLPRVTSPSTSRGGNVSYLQQVTPPSMDSNGKIWSGSGDTCKGSIVGHADTKWDAAGRAYFVSNYKNHYGSVSPRRIRAPHLDRKIQYKPPQNQFNTSKIFDSLSFGPIVISPYDGQVYRDKLNGGYKTGIHRMGFAQLSYHNGRPYYHAQGRSVWKASPTSNTILTKVDQNGNTVYRDGVTIGGMNGNDFHRLDNGQKLAVGLFHVIGELINK